MVVPWDISKLLESSPDKVRRIYRARQAGDLCNEDFKEAVDSLTNEEIMELSKLIMERLQLGL